MEVGRPASELSRRYQNRSCRAAKEGRMTQPSLFDQQTLGDSDWMQLRKNPSALRDAIPEIMAEAILASPEEAIDCIGEWIGLLEAWQHEYSRNG